MTAVSKLVEAIDARFVSGNEVPVERAHIKRDEWEQIRDALLKRPVTIQEARHDER